ncbi:hypothetical protein [Xenorhabdus hominickii]|uniref:Uncharacterized protein n=1 Tax=Xenorhabdus hominickii TaxID=351679 RepID=A0A1V0M464_XENHO|nr:hypothetical protein [Xenorhabdus hominickii]ARD69659.1 hypothetical protein [Xenorhabdus hominickii]PHM52373.1 hypothetical protein Xhom_04451 [Xenorhabdus hominickii]
MYKLKVKESVTDLPNGTISSKTAHNGFRVRCDTTGNTQTYFLCQNIVLALKKGNIKPSQFSECQCAMKSLSCPALHMMLSETKEGRVMYYKHCDSTIEKYPAKPQAKSNISRPSWYKPEMKIAAIEFVEPEQPSKLQDVQTIASLPEPAKKPTPTEKSTPLMPENIYESAMLEAYKQEEQANTQL